METELLIRLGERIKSHREQLGLSQAALALQCDTDRQNMSRIEKGRVNITFLTLVKIAQGLNVSVKELVDF